jgi:hypothetical protein
VPCSIGGVLDAESGPCCPGDKRDPGEPYRSLIYLRSAVQCTLYCTLHTAHCAARVVHRVNIAACTVSSASRQMALSSGGDDGASWPGLCPSPREHLDQHTTSIRIPHKAAQTVTASLSWTGTYSRAARLTSHMAHVTFGRPSTRQNGQQLNQLPGQYRRHSNALRRATSR